MSTTDLKTAISTVKAQIEPLQRKLDRLVQELEQQEAAEFIAVNRIIRADVELSSGPDRPWFGSIGTFVPWLRANSSKNWAEWNTCIYRTSDLLAGRMPEMPAYMDDLPR